MLASILLVSIPGFFDLVNGQGDFYEGRATHYGVNPGAGDTIMNGNCGYGYMSKYEPVGWDVGALSDATEAFRGACGRCYEVKCNPTVITDDYGQDLDRTGSCYDSSASLVIRITDACPCNFPNNAYSNSRWCCGTDTIHIDLSIYAFEKLADPKWGAIGIQYRVVPCYYKPGKQAYLPSGKQPFPDDYTFKPSDNKLPMRGYDWTSLKASYVQVESAVRTIAVDGGVLIDDWQFVGDEISSSPVVKSVQGSQARPPKRYAQFCFRVPGNGGTALFVSKYENTFSNITGMAFSIVPPSSGLLPEVSVVLGAYEDVSHSPPMGNYTKYMLCDTSIPLNTLVPVNQSAWNVTFKSPDAPKIVSSLVPPPPPKGVLPEVNSPSYAQGRGGPASPLSELTQSMASRIPRRPAPQANSSNVTASQINSTRPQLYVVGLGGWLDTCQYSTARDRIFLGCGDLPASVINAIGFQNSLPVTQDVCVERLYLTPATITGSDEATN